MNITIFFAQLWGPVLLAIAIGIFLNRDYYIRLYRDFDKRTLSVLIFGMAGMAAGIAQIYFHNMWETLPQILVSFLGWGLAIKAALFLMAPKFADKVSNGWANLKLIPLAGALILVVGGYLTWIGYFA